MYIRTFQSCILKSSNNRHFFLASFSHLRILRQPQSRYGYWDLDISSVLLNQLALFSYLDVFYLDVIILFFVQFKQYSLRFFFFTLVRTIRNKQQASTRPTLDSIFQISILYISSRNNLDFVHRFHFRHGVHVSAMFFFSGGGWW